MTRVRADFRSRLSIQGSLLRRAMADVLAVTWAGAVHLLHGHLEWLGRQIFDDRNEREFLVDRAAMYGLSPTAATFASGEVLATGTDGSVIPVDTILERDDGVTYRTTAEKTISGGNATVPVEAVEAGDDGNMEAGGTLELESPIAGVDSGMTVDSDGITGGNDEESTEAFRERFLLRLQEPPQGGADQDYEAWALEVAGVTRAWVYEHENGLGTVTVRFVRDDDGSTVDDIFPDAAEVTEVQDKLDDERPITADVTAAAPTKLEVDFTISVTPDTTTVRDAVEAELEDLFVREAEPGDGSGRGTILLSQMLVAIGVAEGVDDFDLTNPSADVVPALGELAVLGTVTWS